MLFCLNPWIWLIKGKKTMRMQDRFLWFSLPLKAACQFKEGKTYSTFNQGGGSSASNNAVLWFLPRELNYSSNLNLWRWAFPNASGLWEARVLISACLIKPLNTGTITVSWQWLVISIWDSGIIIRIINSCDTSICKCSASQFGRLTPRSYLRDPADELRQCQMCRDTMKGKWKPCGSVWLPACCPLNFSDNSVTLVFAFPLSSYQIFSSTPCVKQKHKPPQKYPNMTVIRAVINTCFWLVIFNSSPKQTNHSNINGTIWRRHQMWR